MSTDKNMDVNEATGEVKDEGQVLAWTVHPLRRRPLVAVLVTIFIFVVAVAAYTTTESKAFGTLALVVMFASLAKFYMPTSYRLSDKRITIKTLTQTLHKNWSQYRSCYPDKNGVLLSPFAEPSRMENFRGLFLIFDRNKDEVVSFVKARIGSSAEKPSDEGKEDS